MTFLQEYVSQLTYAEKIGIIRNFEQFERDGFIGNEPIRIHTNRAFGKMGVPEEYITVSSMTQLAFECYRHFANMYLDA
jgi:hypothetical protein